MRRNYAGKAYELEVVTAEDDEGPAVVLVIELSLVLTVALALLLLAGADDTEDMIRKSKKAGLCPSQTDSSV